VCFYHLVTSTCASHHNGVHFFDISSSKSGPNVVCFSHFDFGLLFHLSILSERWLLNFRHLCRSLVCIQKNTHVQTRMSLRLLLCLPLLLGKRIHTDRHIQRSTVIKNDILTFFFYIFSLKHRIPWLDAAIASAIADARVNDQPAVESTAPKTARNNVSQRPWRWWKSGCNETCRNWRRRRCYVLYR